MDTHCHGAGRTNKEGSLSCKPEAKLQQELQEQRAVRGCVRHLQVQGEVLPHCLQPVIPLRCCSAVRCALLMSQVSPRAAPNPGSSAPAAAAPAELLGSLDPRGDFRGEKCSFPSKNHGSRDLPTHTSPPAGTGRRHEAPAGAEPGRSSGTCPASHRGQLSLQGFHLLPARNLHMDYSPCKDSGSNVKSGTQVINK